MRLGAEALRQCRSDARLADAGFARDQHDLAVARLGARPAAQQQVDLLVAADQRGQRRSAQRLEPARDDARTQYLPAGTGPAMPFTSTAPRSRYSKSRRPAGACPRR